MAALNPVFQLFTTTMTSSPDSGLLYLWSPLVIAGVVFACIVGIATIITCVVCCFCCCCMNGNGCPPAASSPPSCFSCYPPQTNPDPVNCFPFCCCCFPPPPVKRVIRRRGSTTSSVRSRSVGSVAGSSVRLAARPRQQIVSFDDSDSRSNRDVVVVKRPRQIIYEDAPPIRVQSQPQQPEIFFIPHATVLPQRPAEFNLFSGSGGVTARPVSTPVRAVSGAGNNVYVPQASRRVIHTTADNPMVSCEIVPDQQEEYVLQSVEGSQSGGRDVSTIGDDDGGEIEIDGHDGNVTTSGGSSFYPSLPAYQD